jgi:hypothetical protein
VVERGPEKAGVGGSIPSLATIHITDLVDAGDPLARGVFAICRSLVQAICGQDHGAELFQLCFQNGLAHWQLLQ